MCTKASLYLPSPIRFLEILSSIVSKSAPASNALTQVDLDLRLFHDDGPPPHSSTSSVLQPHDHLAPPRNPTASARPSSTLLYRDHPLLFSDSNARPPPMQTQHSVPRAETLAPSLLSFPSFHTLLQQHEQAQSNVSHPLRASAAESFKSALQHQPLPSDASRASVPRDSSSLQEQLEEAQRQRDEAIVRANDLAQRFVDVEKALETLSTCSKDDAERLRSQANEVRHYGERAARLTEDNMALRVEMEKLRTAKEAAESEMEELRHALLIMKSRLGAIQYQLDQVRRGPGSAAGLEDRGEVAAELVSMNIRKRDANTGLQTTSDPQSPLPSADLTALCIAQERKIVELLQMVTAKDASALAARAASDDGRPALVTLPALSLTGPAKYHDQDGRGTQDVYASTSSTKFVGHSSPRRNHDYTGSTEYTESVPASPIPQRNGDMPMEGRTYDYGKNQSVSVPAGSPMRREADLRSKTTASERSRLERKDNKERHPVFTNEYQVFSRPIYDEEIPSKNHVSPTPLHPPTPHPLAAARAAGMCESRMFPLQAMCVCVCVCVWWGKCIALFNVHDCGLKSIHLRRSVHCPFFLSCFCSLSHIYTHTLSPSRFILILSFSLSLSLCFLLSPSHVHPSPSSV